MPGALFHLTAGIIMFFIGCYYFKSYFDRNDKIKERLLLAVACLVFSFIPDFFLIIHYISYMVISYMVPFETFLKYHDFAHILLGPITIFSLIILNYIVNLKRKP